MIRKHLVLGIVACASFTALLAGCDFGAPVPSDVASAGAAGGGNGATTTPTCERTYVFHRVTDVGTALDVTDVQTTAQNYTGAAETLEVRDSHTTMVSIEQTTKSVSSFTASLSEQAGFSSPTKWRVSASVQAEQILKVVYETDSIVQQAVTVSEGSNVWITVPAGATGYVLYGVEVLVVRGVMRSSGCSLPAQRTLETVFVPMSYSYCSFVRGPDEFTDGGYGTAGSSSNCQVINYEPGQ